jgi:hypothetical protein
MRRRRLRQTETPSPHLNRSSMPSYLPLVARAAMKRRIRVILLVRRGRGLSPLPPEENSDAQLFAQSRTPRIRQAHSFDFSIVLSTSPLRAVRSYL